MGHPHPILEFQWPIGKEVPLDVRRLTVSEFYLAVQLAAKCVRTAKGEEPVPHVQVNPQLYAELKAEVEEQLKEVNGEIAILKELLQEQEESQPQAQPQAQAQPQPQKKQRGRPRKVQFT